MEVLIFKVVKTQSTTDIITNEELAPIGGAKVRQVGVCELQLECGCVAVSLLVSKDVYDAIKDDKEIIVEESGWWSTLSSKNVNVKRTNGEVIKPLQMF